MFRLRIDIVSDLNTDNLIEVCRPDTYVIVRHELPTGNPHYHTYFKYDNEMKENTLRQRIKRRFEFLKPSDYSIKKCDEERTNEYVQYMFNTKHGNKWELIDTLNFDLKLLNTLKENAQKISTDYADTHKKSKGPTMWDLAQEIEFEYSKLTAITINDLGTQTMEEYHDNRENMIAVYIDLAIKVCRKHHKAFDEFMLRKLITTAQTSTNKGIDKLRTKMLNYYKNE